MNEGLIVSHDINKIKPILENKLKILGLSACVTLNYNDMYGNNFIFEVEFENYELLNDINIYDNLMTFINNLGYFTSSYAYIDKYDIYHAKPYDYDKFIIKINKNDFKYIQLIFESKFDTKYYNNVKIPTNLYHVSPSFLEYKILNNGLIPRHYNKKANHPDRIYITSNYNQCINLINDFKNYNVNNKISYTTYNIYGVSLHLSNITLHTDPHCVDGYFVCDSISPENIKLIKSNI
jgi:hypothetical protein